MASCWPRPRPATNLWHSRASTRAGPRRRLTRGEAFPREDCFDERDTPGVRQDTTSASTGMPSTPGHAISGSHRGSLRLRKNLYFPAAGRCRACTEGHVGTPWRSCKPATLAHLFRRKAGNASTCCLRGSRHNRRPCRYNRPNRRTRDAQWCTPPCRARERTPGSAARRE